MFQPRQPWFGLRGGWLTFWVTVACATDMTLFGYDQGVFGMFNPVYLSLVASYSDRMTFRRHYRH